MVRSRQTDAMLAPFMKWAGGKRQLLPELSARIARFQGQFSHYCEPFLGGGALLFHLRPTKALLNDVNPELINVYQVVREQLEPLLHRLREHEQEHCEAYYYDLRDADLRPDFLSWSKVERAARILYLNKTCYNGLFRVNSKGHFNVPYGRYAKPRIVNEAVLRTVSAYLSAKQIRFANLDFEKLEPRITKRSLVYVDPPYQPLSPTSSFTSYAMHGFNLQDQERLRDFCQRLIVNKGCKVLVSNSYCPPIVKLYGAKPFKLEKIPAARSINSQAAGRGKIFEALITGG